MSIESKIGEHEATLKAHKESIDVMKLDIKIVLKKVHQMKWYFVALFLTIVASGFRMGGESLLDQLLALIV